MRKLDELNVEPVRKENIPPKAVTAASGASIIGLVSKLFITSQPVVA